jgi:tRNA threonylcarbamoyladenosine biosynthesis protein TsaB
MKLLAIETATPCVACALWSDDGPVASFALAAGQRHAEVLVPAVDELCRRAGWSVEDLDGVAVDVGPGLFTGLRVGLATANTIATARGIPAVGVTSLEALAYPHRRRPGPLAAVVDARRGEVYWAVYGSEKSDGGDDGSGPVLRELRLPAVASPEVVAALAAGLNEGAGENVLAVGDGAWRYRELFQSAAVEVGTAAERWPSPLAVAELGYRRMGDRHMGEKQSLVGPRSLPEPVYLRQADVRIGWDEVGGRVSGPQSTVSGAASPSGAPKLAP